MQPAISVIMPAYNAERYINETVESVLQQDFDDFEFIIIDDGSTDGTGALLQALSQRDSRVKVYSQANAGAGAAKNLAIDHANGAFIAFLDADDIFEPSLFSKLHAAALKDDADVTVCNASAFLDATGDELFVLDGHLGLKAGAYRTSDIEERLFQIFGSAPWGKLFRASLIRNNSLTFQDLPRSYDVRFVYSALVCSNTISVIDDALVRYRIGAGGSLLDKATKEPLCDLMAYDALRSSLQELGRLHGKREGLSRSLDNACVCMVVSNMVRYLSASPETASLFLSTYLSHYESAWGLRDIPHYYRYLYSKPKALAYRRMRLLNERGIAWVSKGVQISRSEGRALAKKSLLMAKVMIATLPTSPYRKHGAGDPI